MSKTDKANEYQQQRSAYKVKLTLKIIDEMLAKEEPISVSNVALKANVSKSFLYKHEELLKQIKTLQTEDSKHSLTLEKKLRNSADKIKRENSVLKVQRDEMYIRNHIYMCDILARKNIELSIFEEYERLINEGIIDYE